MTAPLSNNSNYKEEWVKVRHYGVKTQKSASLWGKSASLWGKNSKSISHFCGFSF